MQELGKFNVKINVIPNGLEKYMGFSINNKLPFIDSVQYRSLSLDSLCRSEDFKYASQEFNNDVLELINQKIFYLYE